MVFQGSSASAAAPSFDFPATEKLVKNNFQMWKAQVMSALRGAQVASFINPAAATPPKTVDKPDDQVPNPGYDLLVAKDQQILNYLLSSLSLP